MLKLQYMSLVCQMLWCEYANTLHHLFSSPTDIPLINLPSIQTCKHITTPNKQTIDIVEEYGMAPDTPMYNVMMRSCERESRWRRALAIYKDMLHVRIIAKEMTPNRVDQLLDCSIAFLCSSKNN